MSCCEGTSGGLERHPGTGCCGTSCAAGKTGCSASEPRIRSCFCQENVGCLDRADCGGFRPRGTAATGACPGPCQCAEEEAWNRNVPPKPNCEWLSNFSELRRQWSDHGRQNNCKCCNCKPCRTAAPCRPCLTPPPTCSTTNFSCDEFKTCCSERLSGGACGSLTAQTESSMSHQQDRISAGGCPPKSCRHPIPSNCSPSPNANMYSCGSQPCSSPSECSIQNSWQTCRPPSSCKPCSPSPRVVQKKRSCCQCISGYCMCQPMPRECNCPPPVQVDARAERECSCDCPSSPECACPPSERRFPTTKVKCPNARLCCPTPRPQPGPKCNCTKCQPCLPPPCDPCTSNKCRTVLPKVKTCRGDSVCEESAPCRTSTSQSSTPCRPTPPCAECRKMSPPCRPPSQLSNSGVTSGSRPGSARLIRLLNRPRSPDSQRSTASSSKHRSPGNEGFGDDDEQADPGCRGAQQCHCGPTGSRGCDVDCDFCCSHHCDEIQVCDDHDAIDSTDNNQCNCGNPIGCADECDYCCSMGCDETKESQRKNEELDVDFDQSQCCCGSDEKTCAESCEYCCSQNCDSETVEFENKTEGTMMYSMNERIGAGGTNCPNDAKDTNLMDKSSFGNEENCRTILDNPVSSDSITKWGSRWFNCTLESTPEDPHLEALSRFSSNCVMNVKRDDEIKCEVLKKEEIDIEPCSKVMGVPLITANPSSACKILRSLISAKSPTKYLHK